MGHWKGIKGGGFGIREARFSEGRTAKVEAVDH